MTNPVRKHIPTSAQVLKEQKELADREREARLAAGRKVVAQQPAAKQPQDEIERLTNQAVAPAKATSVAVPDTRTPQQTYLDEIAPASLVGRQIKFGKDGRFVTADDSEPIGEDVDFVALPDQTLIGYMQFNGEGEPPDRRMGLLYDGYIMPPRATLGDTDVSQWEIGLDGKPADPWQHFIYLVLQRGDTGELFTYTTSSVTGRRAIGNLLRHYDRLQRTHPDMYPCVRLKTGGFNHRDDRVGWVNVPVLAVVGRAPKDSTAKPNTSPAADLDDSISF